MEEKQRTQLERHEETMRVLLEAVKREILEKLTEVEQSQQSNRKGIARKATAPPSAEQKARMEDARLKMPSCSDVNGAMMAAAGGAKIKDRSGKSKSSSAFELEEVSSSVFKASVVSADFYTPNPGVQAVLYDCVKSRAFEAVSAAFILAYTLAVGIMSDIDMRAAIGNRGEPEWRWWVDLFFNGIFVLEVLLRILAEGRFFFLGKERGWNAFDLLVTAAGLMDILTTVDVSLSILRILRAFRVVRVLRVIRVFRFFKELRMMVASILCCLVSLSWAFMLLIGVMYIFAVVLLQGASDFLRQETEVDSGLREVLKEDFGDMWKTIFSLTQAVSGGRSWGEYATPLIKISSWYGILFTLFVVFVIWGVLNILTGVFVESTAAMASYDKELVIQEQMSRNESVIGQMRALFREIDVDNSGTITLAELRRNIKDERVKAYFGVLQMDVSEAVGLFQLLDRDESGEVSVEEFIMSCLRLKGGARSIDLVSMLFEHKRLYTLMTTFMGNVNSALHSLEASVGPSGIHEHERAIS